MPATPATRVQIIATTGFFADMLFASMEANPHVLTDALGGYRLIFAPNIARKQDKPFDGIGQITRTPPANFGAAEKRLVSCWNTTDKNFEPLLAEAENSGQPTLVVTCGFGLDFLSECVLGMRSERAENNLFSRHFREAKSRLESKGVPLPIYLDTDPKDIEWLIQRILTCTGRQAARSSRHRFLSDVVVRDYFERRQKIKARYFDPSTRQWLVRLPFDPRTAIAQGGRNQTVDELLANALLSAASTAFNGKGLQTQVLERLGRASAMLELAAAE